MKIGPHDQLPAGTKIRVGNRRGEIVSARIEKDQFGAPIVVHRVKLLEIFSHKIGGREIWKPCKKIHEQDCNYSFIQVIN